MKYVNFVPGLLLKKRINLNLDTLQTLNIFRKAENQGVSFCEVLDVIAPCIFMLSVGD